jgi:hypothetical protein
LLLARNGSLPRLSLCALRELNGLGQQLDSTEAVMKRPFFRAIQGLIAAKECRAGPDGGPEDDEISENCRVTSAFQIPMGSMTAKFGNTRYAQYNLLRSRNRERKVVRQATDSWERAFLEIDASYQSYHAANRQSAALKKRLEAQRGYYDEGRITVSRLLGAARQYAAAVTTEHQYLATYNISFATLSEAKGTLLTDRNIIMADGPDSQPARRPARELEARVIPVPLAPSGRGVRGEGPWQMPGSHRLRAGILGGLGCDSRTFAPFGRAVKASREHRPAGCPFGVEDMDGTALFGKEASQS